MAAMGSTVDDLYDLDCLDDLDYLDRRLSGV